MFLHAPQIVPSAMLLLRALSPKRMIAYAGLAGLVVCAICYVLWRLPIYAWISKPIEYAPECPHCGSKDIRTSYSRSAVDRLRRGLGLLPCRCRACRRKFIRRTSGMGLPEPGL